MIEGARMNLLHFLSVSQSFSGVKDSPSPYRIAREGWLPRFNPADATRGITPPTAAPLMTAPVETPSVRLESAQPVTVQRPAPAAARVANQPGFQSTVRAGERPRQTELSLEAVRVVRNDLSDGDFDVVRRRPAGSVVEHTTSPVAAIEKFGRRGGLNWLAARFFRLGRTQI
jgi:hypothetical protein